jgi:two-component system response regulator HydG
MRYKVYICDDEPGMCRYLRKLLLAQNYLPECFTSARKLLETLDNGDEQRGLLLLDVKMPELDGLEILRQVGERHPGLSVAMMTGHGTIESAVAAMKMGAFDYLTKPFPQERLFALVENALERLLLREENRTLKQELKGRIFPGAIIIKSPAFRNIYNMALRVAGTDANVLVSGESGTGKELIASSIHYHGARSQRLFLAINCAALAENLLESQLFGHTRGAFTGAWQTQHGLLEEADGGTLFLDEIGELSLGLQAKLLRVLENGEFLPVGATRPKRTDVRFIAATNKDLERETKAGRFREDLYYRLNVVNLKLPPLRERQEEIEPLVDYFMHRASQKIGRPISGLNPDALAALKQYAWPGNVRELENIIERATILCSGDRIDLDSLPLGFAAAAPPGDGFRLTTFSLREAEKLQLSRALSQTRWNKSQAAGLLGITRKTLDKKIREFSLAAARSKE